MTRPDEQYWNRLSAWGIGTRVIKALPSLIPALIGVFFVGRSAGPVFFIVAGLALSVLVGLLPWLTTRWRVTDDQLELRHGLVRRISATARRDRIRSVDVTAGPLERVLGLRKVVVGTGVGGKESALTIDPIPAAQAEQLGRDLLRRTAADAAPSDPATGAEQPEQPIAQPAPEEELARLRPGWIRFAPYSLTGFAFVAAGAGIGFRIVDEAGFLERGSDLARSWLSGLIDLGVAVLVPLGLVVLVALSMVVSVVAYVLAFWGFRLVRRPDGALHTTRGLISTVAATIERKRVRGIQLHEPVLMRLPGGAKLKAIATGTDRNPTLLPPAPRAEAVRVADDVLGRPGATESGLQPHGRAALRRRYTRAVIGSAVCAAPFAALAIAMLVAERRDDVSGVPAGWWVVPAALAVAVLALAVPLARIRYAHLGSAVHGGITVLGSGTLARTRTVLESDGVVGFVTTETFFQRRAGVATLHIATAAGAFGATDVTPARAAETARTVEPAIVTSFLTGPGE